MVAWLNYGRQHKGVVWEFNTGGNFQKNTLYIIYLVSSCVFIFPIPCDLRDFLYPEFISTNKLKGVKTRDKGNRLNRNGSGK